MRRVELDDAGGAEHLGAKVPMVIELEWDGDSFTGFFEQAVPWSPEDPDEQVYAGGASIRAQPHVDGTTVVRMHFQMSESQARAVYAAWGKVLAEGVE